MAPLYHIDLMTRSGQGASKQLTTLLKSTSNLFWKHGAVVADMRSWGTCELAYRIRKAGMNHYNAHYITLQVYCAPKVLHEVEGSFRTNQHVLRYMALKQQHVPPLDEHAQKWFKPPPKEEPLELQADTIEAAKAEYRNLVMQRVFEGRTKQEMIAEQLVKHRFQRAEQHSQQAMSQYHADQARAAALSVASMRAALEGVGSLAESMEDEPLLDVPEASSDVREGPDKS